MSRFVEMYEDAGVGTTVVLVTLPYAAYVEVSSEIGQYRDREGHKIYSWVEPTADEMRDMVDHVLKGTNLKRKGKRDKFSDSLGTNGVGYVWHYNVVEDEGPDTSGKIF